MHLRCMLAIMRRVSTSASAEASSSRKRGRVEPSAGATAAPTASSTSVAESRDFFAAGSRVDEAPQEAPGSPTKERPIEPHPAWTSHLALIKAARAAGGAPVDSMGCERTSDPSAPPFVRRFQTLVSLMLSSQTKDEANAAAMIRLREGIPGGLTAATVSATSIEKLEQLIYPVSFYRNKAKFVHAASVTCAADFGGDIPGSVGALCELKGVGPKMAFICMDAAWGKNVGIGVDTHVHRIANRLRWVKTTRPEVTQVHLQSWLPRNEWGALNVLLVGFGQTVCKPVGPVCGDCKLREICPEASGLSASLRAAAPSSASNFMAAFEKVADGGGAGAGAGAGAAGGGREDGGGASSKKNVKK